MSRVHGLVILLAAWGYYGWAQGDPVLPAVTGAAALLGITPWARPLRAGLAHGLEGSSGRRLAAVGCLLLGLPWRALVFPPPAAEMISVLTVVAALQSALLPVGCGVLLGWPAASRERMVLLVAWATVAVSSNVVSTVPIGAGLGLFVLLNLALVLRRWWLSGVHRDGRAMAIVASFVGVSLLGAAGLVVAVRGTERLADDLLMGANVPFPARIQSPFLIVGGPDPSGLDHKPVLELQATAGPPVYLRTQVFSEYHNGVWRASPADGERPLAEPQECERMALKMVLFEPFSGVLPAPAGTTHAPLEAWADEYDLVHREGHTRLAGVCFDPAAGSPAPALDELPALTEVPESLRAVLTPLVDDIVGPDEAPAAVAAAVQSHFRREYQYSLTPDLPQGERALEVFLTERRAAYCVYFASATALMLRVRGIPARVVGGFLAQETEGPRGDRMVVRIRDAHAWAEAYLPVDPAAPQGERAWVRVDATPADARMDTRGPTGALRALGDRISRAVRRMAAEAREGNLAGVLWRLLRPWLLAAAVIGACVVIWRRVRRRSLRRRASSSWAPEHGPLQDLYDRFDAAVATAPPRHASETDAELVRRLRGRSELTPQAHEQISAFLDLYRQARFRDPAGAPEAELVKVLERLEDAVREPQPDADGP